MSSCTSKSNLFEAHHWPLGDRAGEGEVLPLLKASKMCFVAVITFG